jgi:ribulose-5-phosphate 4-epimerase/fuculose-1-phosphate aldolase
MSSAAKRVAMNTGIRANVNRERRLGLRLSIVDGGRQLAKAKVIRPGQGNLSARIDQHRFFVTPTGKDKGKLSVDELFEVEIESFRIPQGASTEVGMHRAIYSKFPTVHAVIYAQPEKVMALAGDGLAPDPSQLPDGGSALDLVSWIDDFAPGTRSLAQEVTLGISRAPSLVIAGYGALTVGATVEQAVIRMVRLERLALMTRGG